MSLKIRTGFLTRPSQVIATKYSWATGLFFSTSTERACSPLTTMGMMASKCAAASSALSANFTAPAFIRPPESTWLLSTTGPPIASKVAQGDSDVVPFGQGSSGSRSLAIGGVALSLASERVIARGRRIAAHVLEAAEPDVAFERGVYVVAGTDRALPFAEVLQAAFDPARVAEGEDLGLDAMAHHMARAVTFPNGCHVCEVEIDPDTGALRLAAYTAVDDFGRVINPLLVDGQVHGGVAQGIGQALLESCIYDDASGQLQSGTFMDYALPRADDLPAFHTAREEVPCRTNALGVKGCGEAGSIVAPAAVVNAAVDALQIRGVHHVDMPLTPNKIWRLLHG